jgi:diadenosine tetraphosphate (Ap4A) HIT family hydrolase
MVNKQDYYSEESQKNARKSKWYDDITRTLTKCPFCDLKDKYILAESGKVVLTMNLFPYIDGHLMVIPRKHVEKFADLSKKDWSDIHVLLDLGIEAIRGVTKIQDINILYREGSHASGSSLKHLHIHIIPITSDFMKYEKQRFIWEFQDITLSPLEMAKKFRRVCKRLQKIK